MESKTKNKKTREQISKMVERAFGGMMLASAGDAVSELKEGWFNVAYCIRLADGKEVILKIAPPIDAEVLAYEKNIMVTEVSSMRLMRENPAIPVPEIYFFDQEQDLCDSNYFFMEKLAGDNLEHVKSSLSPENQTEIELRIGAIVHEINRFTGSYFGYEGNSDLRGKNWKDAFIKIIFSVMEDGQRKNVDYGIGYDEIREAILKHAASLEAVTTPQLVHWDAWDSNFFVKDGKISGIIDFERALWGDPLMEAQFRPVFGEGISNGMRGYGKTSFTYEEEERCHLYTLHLALIMNTECYYRNYDTDFVYNISKQLMGASLTWLKEN